MWEVRIPVEILVCFTMNGGDEHDATAEAIVRVCQLIKDLNLSSGTGLASKGIAIKPFYMMATKPKGTPEPDPRD